MRTEIDYQYKNILKMVKYMFAIPAHNANNERIFSLINIHWTNERDLIKIETVESLLHRMCIQFQYELYLNVQLYGLTRPKLLKQGRCEKNITKRALQKKKSSGDSAGDVIEID